MFPVVCTAKATCSPEFIDGFLRETYGGFPEAPQELCIIYTDDKTAYQQDESVPSEEQAKQGQAAQTQEGGPMKTPSRPP